jgi:RNA polymerase sigma factor (sigma-70 family)
MTIIAEFDVQTVSNIQSDGDLLSKIAESGSKEHFQLLVERHSTMVMNVCRRQLGDAHDAEDSAQAVFLVLWNKAASLKRRTSVVGWLHNLARNVCRNAQRARAARKKHERGAAEMNIWNSAETDAWNGIKDILDDELSQLPEKYRMPIILFYLEGRSQTEIAELLNTKQPTVATQIKRGRELLSKRMRRHGIEIGVAMLAATMTANAHAASVPATFAATTAKAATMFAAGEIDDDGVLSANTLALTKGALSMLSISKFKTVAVAIVVAAVVLSGSVAIVQRIANAEATRPVNGNTPNGNNAKESERAAGNKAAKRLAILREQPESIRLHLQHYGPNSPYTDLDVRGGKTPGVSVSKSGPIEMTILNNEVSMLIDGLARKGFLKTATAGEAKLAGDAGWVLRVSNGKYGQLEVLEEHVGQDIPTRRRSSISHWRGLGNVCQEYPYRRRF